MIVDPAPGALVRDPATTLAIAAGATINENDPYWARLLVDGDVAPASTVTTAPRAATNREGAEK